MKRRALLLLALLGPLFLPGAAWADGQFLQLAGAMLINFSPIGWVVGVGYALVVAGAVYGSSEVRRKQRQATAKARQAYNDALTDRSITALQATPPLRVVYGRAITGGDVVAIFTSDKTGTREDGASYTKPDALKHIVIALASHQCHAIHEVYIEGVPVGALDSNGYPTGGAFYATRTDSRQVNFTGSVTVSEPVVSVLNAYSDAGGDAGGVPQTVTLTPPSTLVGPAGVNVYCNYTVSTVLPSVRLQLHLGLSDQAADAYLMAQLPSQWTSADRLRNITYIVATLDLEDPRFQGGLPNITADVSGALLFDPRTGTTAHSANPALCIRHFLLGAHGYAVDEDDIDDASIITAANDCDATISLTVGGVTTTGAQYTCNGTYTTASSREAALEDLSECMAGHTVYGAQWRTLAGVWTVPVLNLTDDDLDGQIEVVQAGAGMDELVNGMRGTYIGAGKATPTDFDAYQNTTFVAADGAELWSDITLPFTDNRARARNLCRIFVERGRSSQVIRYPAKMLAWPLQIGDRVTVTSAEFGLVEKPYRLTDWQFGIATAVTLTLQEDAAEIYDQADAASADPTPNTALPDPWSVAAITSLVAASGTGQLYTSADGTVSARVHVTWAAVASAYVVDGGRIELLWRQGASYQWRLLPLPGDATGAWIDRVAEGEHLVIEARAVNALGVRSAPAYIGHVVVGKTAAPANVAGLATTALPGGVAVSWTASTEADHLETEVRHGASWAAGTTIFKGRAAAFVWPWPTAGSYTLRARHRDTSGIESASDATAAVTVGDGNLISTSAMVAGAATEVISDSQTAPTASRTRPGVGIFNVIAQILAEASYTNSSGASQTVELSIDGGAIVTSGTGSAWLGCNGGTNDIDGDTIDGDHTAGLQPLNSSTYARRPKLSTVTLADGATLYAQVYVVINPTTGTIDVTGRECSCRLTVIKR